MARVVKFLPRSATTHALHSVRDRGGAHNFSTPALRGARVFSSAHTPSLEPGAPLPRTPQPEGSRPVSAARRVALEKQSWPSWLQTLLGFAHTQAADPWSTVDPARATIFVNSACADVDCSSSHADNAGTRTVRLSSSTPISVAFFGKALLVADEHTGIPSRFMLGDALDSDGVAVKSPPRSGLSCNLVTEMSGNQVVGVTFTLSHAIERVEVSGSASFTFLDAAALADDVAVVARGSSEVVLPPHSRFTILRITASSRAVVSAPTGLHTHSFDCRLSEDAAVTLPDSECQNISAGLSNASRLSGIHVVSGGQLTVRDGAVCRVSARRGANIICEGAVPSSSTVG